MRIDFELTEKELESIGSKCDYTSDRIEKYFSDIFKTPLILIKLDVSSGFKPKCGILYFGSLITK